MIPGTPAREVFDAHHGFRTNKAATRIKCLGAECGAIMDLPDGGLAEASHETFVGHLRVLLRPISDLDDPLVEPPF